ncbi:hypothetical protein [Ruegeria arenilitoris]|uniref:hypothetical protein n=1 Tax=Ruegeria arenilitoris TaxID=1173585 RepID=UPI00147D3176|nr:hypothetical protein [Ruegeria arenilitoris]
MDATERPSFWRFDNPIMWACIASMGFIALIVWFGLAPTCNHELFPEGDCPPKWRHLYAAPPNEVGDTLAGLAGVLAFIWLIATVLLQSVELGEQRRVLALQKEEMEEQRKATQDMARSMSVQATIFEEEQEQRRRAYSKDEITAVVSAIVTHAEIIDDEVLWSFDLPNAIGYVVVSQPFRSENSLKVRHFVASLQTTLQTLSRYVNEGPLVERPEKKRFLELIENVRRLEELGNELAGDQKIRIQYLRIPEFRKILGSLLALDIWKQEDTH